MINEYSGAEVGFNPCVFLPEEPGLSPSGAMASLNSLAIEAPWAEDSGREDQNTFKGHFAILDMGRYFRVIMYSLFSNNQVLIFSTKVCIRFDLLFFFCPKDF